ncbi:hypothetical protein HPB48_000060 [Haemaphysalis longicornis]|uniref:Uncharacterized protein n=1 Tax=Haemaphysalis longicornis TaxID=44386 RepID=A0A9J6FMN3_HAELO|nr:hypothetical protein HPB48_000060 [Haemaphysalis longicornis]
MEKQMPREEYFEEVDQRCPRAPTCVLWSSLGTASKSFGCPMLFFGKVQTDCLENHFGKYRKLADDHVKRAGNLTAAKEGGSCLGSLTGLLIKRLLCFIRSLVPFATGWVLPVCVFWALFALEHRLAPPRKRRITHLSVPLYLRAAYPGASAFAHWDGDENRALAEATFLPQLRSSLSSSSSVDFFEDPVAELLAMGAEDFIAYSQDYALGISLTERVEVWHNPYAKLSREIGLAIASTSALRLVSEVRNSSIMTRVVLADLVGLSSVEQRGDSDEQLSEYIK